jgi:hypothetical protein
MDPLGWMSHLLWKGIVKSFISISKALGTELVAYLLLVRPLW